MSWILENNVPHMCVTIMRVQIILPIEMLAKLKIKLFYH